MENWAWRIQYNIRSKVRLNSWDSDWRVGLLILCLVVQTGGPSERGINLGRSVSFNLITCCDIVPFIIAGFGNGMNQTLSPAAFSVLSNRCRCLRIQGPSSFLHIHTGGPFSKRSISFRQHDVTNKETRLSCSGSSWFVVVILVVVVLWLMRRGCRLLQKRAICLAASAVQFPRIIPVPGRR